MNERPSDKISNTILKWDDPVSFVKGAGSVVRRAWKSLGIQTIADLILTLPRRYDDFSCVMPIHQTQTDQVYTVKGRVKQCRKLNTFRKRIKIYKVVIDDGTGAISANFFNQPWLLEKVKPDMEIFLSGKVKFDRKYGRHMSHPILEMEDAQIASGKISPVYGLSGTLAQKTYRRLMQYVLDHVEWPKEAFSKDFLDHYQLVDFSQAARCVHIPQSSEDMELGRRRFAFDELFGVYFLLEQVKEKGASVGGIAIPFDQTFAEAFVKHLPFTLTNDQKRASWEIFQDLEKTIPMRRLLQGDVGSGKTVVATFVAGLIIRAGQSAVLFAPTDILAKQHYQTIKRLLAPWNIPIRLVTRSAKKYACGTEDKDFAEDASFQSQSELLIGTHAILFKQRIPKDITLGIIDEQQRFGVQQREALLLGTRFDGKIPHLLSMTATPIPRSLALTLYGDLSISSIREKPKNRQPIETQVLSDSQRHIAYQAILDAKKRGERAFIICPFIDVSDTLGKRSVEAEYKRLCKTELRTIKLGMLHGRLKAEEKDKIMQDLQEGTLDAIVSTTVIEIGIDIPDATVILIEGAEHFGLAQLHQLRGRVGRSDKPSMCFLLSSSINATLERLQLLEKISDGFRLAEEDLKLRGSGKLLGVTQSGFDAFRAVRMTDVSLMKQAKEAVVALKKERPDFDPNTIPGFQMKQAVTEHLE